MNNLKDIKNPAEFIAEKARNFESIKVRTRDGEGIVVGYSPKREINPWKVIPEYFYIKLNNRAVGTEICVSNARIIE